MFKPDFNQFLKMVRGEQPDRPVLFEHYMDWPFIFDALGDDVGPQNEPKWGWIVNQMNAYAKLGYDTMHAGLSILFEMQFPTAGHAEGDSISQNEGGMISDHESLASYPWPDPEKGDYHAILDEIEKEAPDGMKLLAGCPRGIFEGLVDLFGFDNLCFALIDEPELVQEVADEIGSRVVRYAERVVSHPLVGGVFISDDIGYKTSLMVSPDVLREIVFPWHKKLVEVVHKAGKIAVLHACGQVEDVMEDIIEDMKYDAKHSFEDVIMPVEEIYEKYGHRIAILGGLDVDFLFRSTTEEVTTRAKALVEKTGCRRYALGSGNSIADGIPPENYKALLSAAQEG